MAYKRVLTIQDVSCVGQCSLTVALPVLSASGNETCILPSAVLSTHTGGFNGWTFRDLTDDFLKIKEHWIKEKIDFDAFYTGYLGSVHKIDLVSSIINSPLKKPDSLIVVDPAMGDYGKLYAGFDSNYVERMKKLVFSADIIIPNFTEACMLTANEYKECHNKNYVSEISAQLVEKGAKTVVITGVSYEKGTLGVFVSDGKKEFYHPHEELSRKCSGTGDMFASAFVGAILRGKDIFKAAVIADDFTFKAIKNTIDNPAHWYGVKFEPLLGEYIKALEE
jgi:pyridoxine kinase